MPKLGESVTEGTINTWLVKEGDHVDKYDPIAEVMTDKVNAEVPSSFSGTIKEIIAKEGETLEVGEVICSIELEGGAATTDEKADHLEETENKQAQTTEDTSDQTMKKRYSPAVLRLAQEHDINLLDVEGTGRGGRITRKDVEKVIASGKAETNNVISNQQETSEKAESKSVPSKPETSITPEADTGDIEIPVSGVRKAIANNMVRSTTEIPHAWMTVEVDVTDLVSYRNEIKQSFKEKEGFNVTYFAFFL